MTVKRSIDTVSLAADIFSLLKSASIILAMTLIEWARMRQRIAEDHQAVAETDLAIEKGKNEIQTDHNGRDPDDLIDEFIRANSDRGPGVK